MTEVIAALEANDEARVGCIKTALRRHLVTETSFLSNRQYDTQNLVPVFDEVSAVRKCGMLLDFRAE